MKRRKFIQWLVGVSAAIALDPVIGGQAIWGTERPKLPKHVDVGVPYVPEPCLGPPGDRVWNAEALENLKAYHLEEEQRLEAYMEGGRWRRLMTTEEILASDDMPCQNLHLLPKPSVALTLDETEALPIVNGPYIPFEMTNMDGEVVYREDVGFDAENEICQELSRRMSRDMIAEENRLLRRLEKASSVQALAKRMVLLEDTNAIVGGLDEDIDYHRKKLFQALGAPDPEKRLG